MLFKSPEFEKSTYFIAMEYCWLILNRTYLIVVEDDRLIGIKINGPIGNQAPGAAGMLAVRGDLNDPFSYIKSSYANKLQNISLLSDEVLSLDSTNFSVGKREIKSISHNPKKKWGMGVYPHDGRIVINTGTENREFIILGSQSGENIVSNILGKLSISANEI